jgi:bacillithiol biosynthesis cysteine-adding enzyme BshC
LALVAVEPQTIAAGGAVRAAIDLRRFPWIRPLVSAYTHEYASVASLFAGNPALPAAWRETIARVQRAPRDRQALAAMLDRQLAARGAPPEARQAAARLADRDTVAIVTGQQAGAFGGPLYTLLKAVTAIQLARRVSADHGVAVVPVFWVDEEDHDWQEIRSAVVLDAGLAVAAVTLGDVAGAGVRPISSLVFDGEVDAAIDRLGAVLAPTEFTAELLARLRARYRAGAGVAAAFAGWIEDLLGRHGLVVFEGADPAAKSLVGDLFAREITGACQTGRLAREAGQAMRRLGHEPQVQPADDAVALFYLDGQGRRPIKCRDGGFAIGDAVLSADELRARVTTSPDRFSPNVLLRPLVQDRLFPTVCYVSGPSELAYQAQLGGIYREFGVEPPLLYPRSSATLLDSAAARFLERHELPLEHLQAQDESALNHLLEQQLPPTVDRAIDETERVVVERAQALKTEVAAIDPTLAGAVDTTLDRIRDTLRSLHGKIIQASKRKDETLRRQFNRTRALVFPDGHAQERVLNVAFFVNRYGPALGDRLIEVLPLETDRHYLITL